MDSQRLRMSLGTLVGILSRPGTRITTDIVRNGTIDSFPWVNSYTEDALAVQEPREKDPKEVQQP